MRLKEYSVSDTLTIGELMTDVKIASNDPETLVIVKFGKRNLRVVHSEAKVVPGVGRYPTYDRNVLVLTVKE